MIRMPKVLLLNAIIPGAGLVVLRREWLGLANSILFAVFALIFIFSRWITPSDIPAWASYLSLAGVIVVWIGSLVFVVQHGRVVSDPDFISEIEHLRQEGQAAIEAGNLPEAHRVLLVALNLNDEDPESWLHWSRLMELQGDAQAAHAGWKRVLRLSRIEEHRLLAKQKLNPR
ncbi:MAG: hypothetical protein R3E58_10685 [Phycisphaerae bacterium]|nr:hypothetical protein [Phycisphaerales bacterium]